MHLENSSFITHQTQYNPKRFLALLAFSNANNSEGQLTGAQLIFTSCHAVHVLSGTCGFFLHRDMVQRGNLVQRK